MPNSGGFRSLVGRHVGGLAGESGFVPNSGGLRSLFGRQVFGLSGSTSPPPPPPPPPPATPTDPAGASYARFYLGKRKKRRRPDLLQPEERAQLRAVLQSAYDEAIGRPATPEAQAIIAGVAPYVPGDTDGVRLAAPDWNAMVRSISSIETILRAYLKARDEEEDEDLILLLH